jgi:hypothetical protein
MHLSDLQPTASPVKRPQPPTPDAPAVRVGGSTDVTAFAFKKRKYAGTHIISHRPSLTTGTSAPAIAKHTLVPHSRQKTVCRGRNQWTTREGRVGSTRHSSDYLAQP